MEAHFLVTVFLFKIMMKNKEITVKTVSCRFIAMIFNCQINNSDHM